MAPELGVYRMGQKAEDAREEADIVPVECGGSEDAMMRGGGIASGSGRFRHEVDGDEQILASDECGPHGVVGGGESGAIWQGQAFPVLLATPAGGAPRSYGSERGRRPLSSPLSSGLWLVVELVTTLTQIGVSIVVLAVSRGEKPDVPLGLWIAGYACGCLGMLPLLYWRYLQCQIRFQSAHGLEGLRRQGEAYRAGPALRRAGSELPLVQLARPHVSSDSQGPPAPPSLREPALHQLRDMEAAWDMHSGMQALSNEPRVAMLVERVKIVLDCFFAVWFVVGNVWVFGGHVSPADAPSLYRLCVVFLTLSCIGYAVPFVLCATICCCLPCIIALVGYSDEPTQYKGATAEAILALPVCKYRVSGKRKNSKRNGPAKQQGADREEEVGTDTETGLLWAGTEQERGVLGEDAVCCICLGSYLEGEELRELPCMHHFHVMCVDTWLKINANCPLCKHEITGGHAEAASNGEDVVTIAVGTLTAYETVP